MVTFVPSFVSEAVREWEAGLSADLERRGVDPRISAADPEDEKRVVAEYAARVPSPVATIPQVADHVEHVRDVAGVAHVGIGGDFDGCNPMPAGLEDVSCYPALIAELMDRGWSDRDLGALTRNNVLRVLRGAEATAAAT
jgi:membrane dipeptidase